MITQQPQPRQQQQQQQRTLSHPTAVNTDIAAAAELPAPGAICAACLGSLGLFGNSVLQLIACQLAAEQQGLQLQVRAEHPMQAQLEINDAFNSSQKPQDCSSQPAAVCSGVYASKSEGEFVCTWVQSPFLVL
jgi:hypothetical protein